MERRPPNTEERLLGVYAAVAHRRIGETVKAIWRGGPVSGLLLAGGVSVALGQASAPSRRDTTRLFPNRDVITLHPLVDTPWAFTFDGWDVMLSLSLDGA